ncbi:MAG: Na+/H+ antiporter NhaC [Flavobacteriales bacterium]|nr:Na+/H+ antiporter NhaC [Flavobacteriales bacterium]
MIKINKEIPFLIALLPLLILIILLASNVYIYGDESLAGPNQIALLLAATVAIIISLLNGKKWTKILNAISRSISSTSTAIIILLLIGSLTGTWLISGIVPAMIYYGLQILNPEIFLFASCIICAIVSLASGSSWSTIATIGIALIGIGDVLGISHGLVAGSIISGAYFGDKMSPLSDTTNLAAAMSGTDLFIHIRYMMYTTIPTFIITLIIFFIIGLSIETSSEQNINLLLSALDTKFNINLWLFIVPLSVVILIIKKTPAIPSLLAGTLLGGIFAIIYQPQIISEISQTSLLNIETYYKAIINAMASDISINTEHELMNNLLTSSGMKGMLSTVWLVICAMSFGGAMQEGGLLKRISDPIISYAQKPGSLIATTSATCIFFNLTTSDQYLSIVVPGRMFEENYKDKGLAPENLSRTLEDSGTVTSVLIPWNTCGAAQSAVLGVATLNYLPYCFFNLISPIMTILYGYLQIKIKKSN